MPNVPYEFKSIELKDFALRLDGLLLPVTPDPSLPILFIEAQMQPDSTFYYRIHNQLATYLKQYQPKNDWCTLVIYPDDTTERAIPYLDRFLTFGNIHRIYLNQIPAGVSFSMDLLHLVMASPENVPSQGRNLVSQLQHFEPTFSQRCLKLITELINRKFPNTSEQEILRMLQLAPFLVPLEQTRAYQEAVEESLQQGLQQGRREVIERLFQSGLSIEDITNLTGLSQQELQSFQAANSESPDQPTH